MHGLLRSIRSAGTRRFRNVVFVIALSWIGGCASVPPQIAQLHQKEHEIITSLQRSHLAMVDAYVDQKILLFEGFFFKEYGPVFLNHWRKGFRDKNGREYEEGRDFHILYNDLVAEYQGEVGEIESVRQDLRDAIAREYSHALTSHEAIGGWINSQEKLNAAHKGALDRLLGAIKPGLSLDTVDKAVDDAIVKAKEKLNKPSN